MWERILFLQGFKLIVMSITDILLQVRQASRSLPLLEEERINEVLRAVSETILERTDVLLEANAEKPTKQKSKDILEQDNVTRFDNVSKKKKKKRSGNANKEAKNADKQPQAAAQKPNQPKAGGNEKKNENKKQNPSAAKGNNNAANKPKQKQPKAASEKSAQPQTGNKPQPAGNANKNNKNNNKPAQDAKPAN